MVVYTCNLRAQEVESGWVAQVRVSEFKSSLCCLVRLYFKIEKGRKKAKINNSCKVIFMSLTSTNTWTKHTAYHSFKYFKFSKCWNIPCYFRIRELFFFKLCLIMNLDFVIVSKNYWTVILTVSVNPFQNG